MRRRRKTQDPELDQVDRARPESARRPREDPLTERLGYNPALSIDAEVVTFIIPRAHHADPSLAPVTVKDLDLLASCDDDRVRAEQSSYNFLLIAQHAPLQDLVESKQRGSTRPSGSIGSWRRRGCPAHGNGFADSGSAAPVRPLGIRVVRVSYGPDQPKAFATA